MNAESTPPSRPMVERRLRPRSAEEGFATELVQALLRGGKAAASQLQVRMWTGMPAAEVTLLLERAEVIGELRKIELIPAIKETRKILFQAGHAV